MWSSVHRPLSFLFRRSSTKCFGSLWETVHLNRMWLDRDLEWCHEWVRKGEACSRCQGSQAVAWLLLLHRCSSDNISWLRSCPPQPGRKRREGRQGEVVASAPFRLPSSGVFEYMRYHLWCVGPEVWCGLGRGCRKEIPTLYLKGLIKWEEMVAKQSTENPGTLNGSIFQKAIKSWLHVFWAWLASHAAVADVLSLSASLVYYRRLLWHSLGVP